MSRPEDPPERLLAREATPFERRVLESALRSGPTPRSSARMAKALGVTAAATMPGAPAMAARNAAANTPLAAARGAAGPWVAMGGASMLVIGAVVGARLWFAAPTPRAPAAAVAPSLQPVPTTGDGRAPTPPQPLTAARPVDLQAPPPSTGALRDQIAFIDSARRAVAHGASARALQLLRRYDDRYPSGSFGPEATAIEVEALVKLGRRDEARGLAAPFLARHRGSLLARRMADLVGLDPTAASP